MGTRIDTTGRCEACGAGHYEHCEGMPCKVALLRAARGILVDTPATMPVRDARAALLGLGFQLDAVTVALAAFTDTAGNIDRDGLAMVYQALKAARDAARMANA